MKRAEVKVLRGDKWQIKGDLVLKKDKLYVPKNKALRVKIIQLYYDIPIAGHKGKQKMMELVTRNYWQLRATKDVGKYMESCNICQRMKNKMKGSVENLKLSEILEKLQIYLIVDFIIKLPLVTRKDTILVICNRLSKTMVPYLTLHFLALDKGLQFAVNLTKELNQMLRIETKLLIVFHS